MSKEIIIISLGGSLIVPDEIDTLFLKKFKKIIISYLKTMRFAIICGGGMIARRYMDAAQVVDRVGDEDRDWLGIHGTRLNAHLLRTIFRNHAHARIIKNPTEKLKWNEDILMAAGWKPGCSTDYDAVLLAKNLGCKTIINLTNIDYVYTKDPRKFKDATRIEQIRWKDYLQLIPCKWKPGLSTPFDPVASQYAAKHKMRVIILNGKKLERLGAALQKKKIIGTVIQP